MTTIRYALAFGVGGAITGSVVFFVESGKGWNLLPFATGVSAFILGFLFWKIFHIEESPTTGKGILAGVLNGTLSHYLAWYLLIVFHNICFYGLGLCKDSLKEGPMNILEGISGAWYLAIVSFLLMGWVTVPAGGLIGYLLVKFFPNSETKE